MRPPLCNKLLQGAVHSTTMAWNVVIAGGGFGGSSAARELERLLPKQSARLMLVNDVNFMLYTPFLPEAAAGRWSRGTWSRRCATSSGAPTCASARSPPTTRRRARSSCAPTTARPRRCATTSSWSRSARSRARCRSPGSTEHAIGFKSLADAIWLRNHVDRDARGGERDRGPGAPRGAAHLRLRRRRLRRPRGARRAPGLRRRRDGPLSAGPPARDALDPGRGDRSRPARDRPIDLADYAVRELRGRGIDIRLGTALEEAADDSTRLSTGERIPTRTVVWTAGVTPHPSLAALALPLDERGRVRVDEYMRVEGMRAASGRSATAPRSRPRRRRAPCPPTAQRRGPPGPGGRPQHRRRARRRRSGRATSPTAAASAFVNLGRYKAVGKIGRLHVPRLPRLVDGAHLPHEPDPRPRAQDPRGRRLDGRPAVPPRHRRGRLDRPSAPAQRPRSTRAAAPTARSTDEWPGGCSYVVIAVCFGLATGIIGRGQGQLVLHLVPGRHGAAAARPDRGDPLPLRARRARAPLPAAAARSTSSTSRSAPAAAPTSTCRTRRGRASRPRLPLSAQPRRATLSAARCGRSRSRSRARSGPRPASSSGRGAALATVTGTSLAGMPRLIASIRNSEVWNCSWRRTSWGRTSARTAR